MSIENQQFHEDSRLKALAAYQILDTEQDARFDQLTQLASLICDAPMAAIFFVDRERLWLKSRIGLPQASFTRGAGFTQQMLFPTEELLILEDAARDPRSSECSWVCDEARVRFYAASPLLSSEGHVIGNLVIMDHLPRELSPRQKKALPLLARQVMQILEARKNELRLPGGQGDLARILENLSDPIFSLDRQNRFTYINRKAEAWLRKDKNALLGRPIWTSLPDLAASQFHKQAQRCLETGVSAEFEDFFPTHNGWFEIRIHPTDQALVFFLRNTTERKFAKEALRRSEARFTGIFRSSLIGIIFGDARGIIEDANDAFLKTVGYTRDDLCNGKVRWDALTPPEYVEASRYAANALRKGEAVAPVEKEYVRKDGSRVPVLVGVTLLREPRDSVVTFVVDLTELRRAELLPEKKSAA